MTDLTLPFLVTRGRWVWQWQEKFYLRTPGKWPSLLTDSTRALSCVLLQQLHDVGLLCGRAAAAHHSGALASQLHELVLIIPETHLQHSAHYISLHTHMCTHAEDRHQYRVLETDQAAPG